MPATILIVDDDWMNRELLQAHLENAGYHVLATNNGVTALEMVASHSPDLLLLDVRMPGMDGYEVCTRLKSSPATQHLPILLITALEDEESNMKGSEAGADDFVHKPFDINDMLGRIQGFLT